MNLDAPRAYYFFTEELTDVTCPLIKFLEVPKWRAATRQWGRTKGENGVSAYLIVYSVWASDKRSWILNKITDNNVCLIINKDINKPDP